MFNGLEPATLIRRYKRFLADVRLPDGSIQTLHCPNSGSMRNCLWTGARVWYSKAAKPGRKLARTLELIESPEGQLIRVASAGANAVVKEAIEGGQIEELRGYSSLIQEVRFGSKGSRLDLLLSGNASDPGRDCYVEIKSVTWLAEGCGGGVGLFPDARTERGSRHLLELQEAVALGHRAMMLFCVQHSGIHQVRPADAVDPGYGVALRQSMARGVEVLAYCTDLSVKGVTLAGRVPVECP